MDQITLDDAELGAIAGGDEGNQDGPTDPAPRAYNPAASAGGGANSFPTPA
jgi:hypothetical protein